MTASWNHHSGASPSHYPSGDDSPDSTASQIPLLPPREYATSLTLRNCRLKNRRNPPILPCMGGAKYPLNTVHRRRKPMHKSGMVLSTSAYSADAFRRLCTVQLLSGRSRQPTPMPHPRTPSHARPPPVLPRSSNRRRASSDGSGSCSRCVCAGGVRLFPRA